VPNFPKQGPPQFQADPPKQYDPEESKREFSNTAEVPPKPLKRQNQFSNPQGGPLERETLHGNEKKDLLSEGYDKGPLGLGQFNRKEREDLYGDVPTEYGALYVVNNYGGYLFDNQFDISWTSTSERMFMELGGEYTRRQMAANPDAMPPGIFITTIQAYTPGADNTTWDTGLSETGQLYSLAELLGYGLLPVPDLFEHDGGDILEYNMADSNDPNTYVLTEPGYLQSELYFLNQKFGYDMGVDTSTATPNQSLEQQILDTVIDFAKSVITDEISNQVINKVIDYKDLSAQDLTSIAGTEAAQASTPGFTSAATAYGNGNGSTTTSPSPSPPAPVSSGENGSTTTSTTTTADPFDSKGKTYL